MFISRANLSRDQRGGAVLRVLLALLTVGAIAAGLGLWWGHRWLNTPIDSIDEPQVFEIPRGANLRAIASALQQRGVMEQPQIWRIWARLTDRASGLKAGEYEL